MGRLFGTPFFDGDGRLPALVLGWLISFACRCDFGLTACEKELGCFCQVLVGWEADEVPHCCCPFSTPFPQTHHAPFTAMCDPHRSLARRDRLCFFGKFFSSVLQVLSFSFPNGYTPSFT